MTPFRAFLAMAMDQPRQFQSKAGPCVVASIAEPTRRTEDHQPVLIVEDTPENRKLLGMEG
jgi:hypothetical protein